MLKTMLTICFALGTLGTSAAVDETKPSDDDKEKRYEVRVERIVQQEQTDDDDEVRATVSGKIVIMGPDGKVNEYSLDDKLPKGIRVLVHGDDDDEADAEDVEENVFVLSTDDTAAAERLMIGVHCDAADEVLRSHLKLGENGLVVLEVIDDSPALDAGVKKGDVLFRANGADLNSLPGLVKVVQDSEGNAIEFEVIRGGDRMEVKVKPRMMKMEQHVVLDHLADMDIELSSEDGPLRWVEKLEELELPEEALKALKNRTAGVRVRKLQPGIVIDRALQGEELKELIEDVRERAKAEAIRAKEAQEKARELHEQAHEVHEDAVRKARVHLQRIDESEESVESMRAQMKELKKQIAALQKALEKMEKEQN